MEDDLPEEETSNEDEDNVEAKEDSPMIGHAERERKILDKVEGDIIFEFLCAVAGEFDAQIRRHSDAKSFF